MPQAADETLDALCGASLEPLFYRPARIGPESAWYGHLPFANWIMRAARPSLFVELGTHAGISYSAFCDAVLADHLPTRCLAVDSWQGDEHAGFYGEEVFRDFARFHDQRYGGFSRLLRQRFDQALETVADASVDLLHIDGRHRFSDITEDFEGWLPKLSPRGVVLLHDTNVRERDFGVWRFWEAVRARYPSFEFLHSHGLGVLATGDDAPAPVLSLCRNATTGTAARLRDVFAFAGERWESEFALSLRDRRIDHLLCQGEEMALGRKSDAAQVLRLETDLTALRERLMEADRVLRAQALELGLARSALAEARKERHRAARQGDALGRILEAEREAYQSLASECRATREALAARTQELAARTQEFDSVRGSSSWKATAPLRAALGTVRRERQAGSKPPVEQLPVGQLPVGQASVPHASSADASAPQRLAQEPSGAIQAAAPGPRAVRRIMFVIGEPGTPGAVYRCLRNAAACRDAGYEADAVALYDVGPENLARADLLVLWRAVMTPHIRTMIDLARAAGTRVIFDIDDLMTRPELARIDIIDGIRTIGATEAETRGYYTAMHATMRAADGAIATTEELAAEMREQREVVLVLPNIFDEATHAASRYARRCRLEAGEDGHVRLGYAGGTRTHQKDFAQAAPALARVLAARPQTLLVLFQEAENQRGLVQIEEFPELEAFADRIEWRDMVPLAELPGELARFDISLAPLEVGNRFCESKSELKFFEASLAGACTIASPTGPFRRAITEGVTGLLAADDAQWEAALLRLVDDPVLRARMARSAYHDVLWRFGPHRQAELAASLIGGFDQHAAPAAARAVELGLRRGDYRARGLPEVPDSALLFAHDALGEAEVTVVMTSYNYERHILEALDSVRAQTLETIDLAVVDDGSTDQSVPLVIEWAKRHQRRFNRIRILRTLRNAGLGGARNVVFDAAETPWLMALDSDNRLLPDACATLLQAVRDAPRAAFAYPRLRQFGGADHVMGEAAFEPARLQTGNYIDAMALVAKWAWAAAGGYYVRRDAMGWEDFDLWLNLVELGQFGVAVPEILAEYRVHPTSMVNAITEQSGNKQEMVRFIEERHPWLRLRNRAAHKRK